VLSGKRARRSGTAQGLTDEAHRIETMTMVAVPITDTAELKRMFRFAADVAELADQRADLDLRGLIDQLHADLLDLKEDR
jgi:hypothetical protein